MMFVNGEQRSEQILEPILPSPERWFFDDQMKRERTNRWSDQQKSSERDMALFPGGTFGTVVAYQTK